MSLAELEIQKIVNELCAQYRKLDAHLGHPKNKLPISFDNYTYGSNGKQKIMISKFFRNIAALEKLETLINHLDSFFIAVEYFQNNIAVVRNDGGELSTPFKDKFFLIVASDSIRSCFDIYAKFVAWFYDLPNKNEVGFSYNNFIKPIENFSIRLMKQLNLVYNSSEYITITGFRNADKHIGFDRFKMEVIRTQQKFELKTMRINDLNKGDLEKCLFLLINSLKETIEITVEEFSKYKLGYTSKDDFEVTVGEDGLLMA